MVSFTSQLSIVLLLLLSATAFNKSICTKNRDVRCNAKDRWTLLIFKKGVVDPSNVLSSWSNEEDCCAWTGVHCDNITGRVTKLDLNSWNNWPDALRGEINLSVLQLEFLNYLDLRDNEFESISIPPIFVSRYAKDRQRYDNQSLANNSPPTTNFSNLQYLDLSYNFDIVMDDLQWLSQISSLRYLNLNFINLINETNWLQSMAMLPSLSELHLSGCHLSNISPSLGYVNFTSLVTLDLSENYDTIMDDLQWLSQVSSLKYLNLSGIDLGNESNWLQSMAMLPSLSELNLRQCDLSSITPSLSYVNFTSLVSLVLSYNNFESELPNWLFNLTSDISYVDLSDNKFHGQIPMALLRLQNLQSLVLSFNKLNGSIPDWLGQLEHLNYLDLSGNLFNGFIPSTLGNLSSLIDLDLSDNHLNGVLPTSLFQLYNLNSLEVGRNPLEGVLSKMNFGKLSNLETLDLGSTSFTFELDPNWVPPFQLRAITLSNISLGPNFPAWLYTQRSLEYLDISRSRISYIDADMLRRFVVELQQVDLSHNSISGDLSKVTLNCSIIYLDYNNFTGSLPHISPNVRVLSASHNSFSGSIFPELCDSVNGDNSLSHLDISYNHLIGALPDCWANWKHLESIDMGSNKITGEVPPSMGALSYLRKLDLQNNMFFGEFSLDLSNLTTLEFLILQKNNFSGSLPSTMPQRLGVMKFRSNQFIGNIPSQICSLSSLFILDLADNILSGSIPQCLYNLTGMILGPINMDGYPIDLFTKGQDLEYTESWLLRSIDLSTNNMSGEIPQELFSLIQVQSLNLSRNHFTGLIPEKIGGMKNLESLDLSHNRLSGEIPQIISNLSFLSDLNMSYNNFTGQIPLGTQIQSFDAWSFTGNPKLCGAPLPSCQKMKESDNSNLREANKDDSFFKSLYLGMGVGFAAGFWGVCGSLFLNRAWRHKFFCLFDHLVDRLYVAIALKFKNFS